MMSLKKVVLERSWREREKEEGGRGERERSARERERGRRTRERKKTKDKEEKKKNSLAPVERVDEVVVEPQHGPDVDGAAADEPVELRREHGGAPVMKGEEVFGGGAKAKG
jgi:hypothetical protein